MNQHPPLIDFQNLDLWPKQVLMRIERLKWNPSQKVQARHMVTNGLFRQPTHIRDGKTEAQSRPKDKHALPGATQKTLGLVPREIRSLCGREVWEQEGLFILFCKVYLPPALLFQEPLAQSAPAWGPHSNTSLLNCFCRFPRNSPIICRLRPFRSRMK